MPITRRQFELGIDADLEDWMNRVHAFLEKHRSEAYTYEELSHEFTGEVSLQEIMSNRAPGKPDDRVNNQVKLRAALSHLVGLNVASERDIGNKAYYATGRYALSDVLEGKQAGF